MRAVSALMEHAHIFDVRVYYEDTDFSQNVYHAAYLKFIERGRTEFLRASGIHHREMFAGVYGEPLAFAVAKMDLEFLRPAHIDDMLRVETRLERVTGARIVLDQRVLRGEELLVRAGVTIAVISGEGRARRIPAALRDLLGANEPRVSPQI